MPSTGGSTYLPSGTAHGSSKGVLAPFVQHPSTVRLTLAPFSRQRKREAVCCFHDRCPGFVFLACSFLTLSVFKPAPFRMHCNMCAGSRRLGVAVAGCVHVPREPSGNKARLFKPPFSMHQQVLYTCPYLILLSVSAFVTCMCQWHTLSISHCKYGLAQAARCMRPHDAHSAYTCSRMEGLLLCSWKTLLAHLSCGLVVCYVASRTCQLALVSCRMYCQLSPAASL